MRPWLLMALALGAGCAAVPKVGRPPQSPESETQLPTAPRKAPTLDEASRRASERIRELERRQATAASPGAAMPPGPDLAERYEELLARPGTPEARKPEIVLRLAEFAYRAEEAVLRELYEAGTEASVPPGSRYPLSIAHFRKLVDGYPDSPQALTGFYNLGYLYAEAGEPARSAWAYSEVLRRDPATPYADEIHMRLGEAAFDGGDVEGAIPHYQAVVENGRPEYADKALYKLGWCLFNLEDYGRAAESFARVMERGRDPGDGLRRETLDVLAKTLLEWGGLEGLRSYLAERPGAAAYAPSLYRAVGDLYVESSRYREAADTYVAGIDAAPTAVECLSMERGIIQALTTSRDLAGANGRRESWGERYAPGSPWDAVHGAGPAGRERDAQVEEGLRLAALYHHGRAQRGQGGLERALRIYRRYLELFGDEAEAGYEMAYAMAHALREGGRLGEAASQYARVARHPARVSHREEASYRRIEVLAAVHREDPGALDELLSAQDEYAALNPASPAVPQVLFAAGELAFEAGRFARARGSFARVAKEHGRHALAPRALDRVARCFFREEVFDRAEEAARQALGLGLGLGEEGEARRLVSYSVFKQGEVAQERGDLVGANHHFLRLADEFPGEEAARIALYRVGENLQALGRDGEAAAVYDRLAKAYRGTPHAQQALVLSAEIFSSLGDWRQASQSLEDLYRADPQAPGAADALFRAARAAERGEDAEVALRLFGEFATRFFVDPRLPEALVRAGDQARLRGRGADAAARYRAAWEAPAKGEADPWRARAALALGRLTLETFQGVPLRGDLEAALVQKEDLLEEALGYLAWAASLPYADAFTEALLRTGLAFEHLKDALLESERPDGLSAEEREEYDFLLEEKAFPLEARAVGYYQKGIAAALRATVYTPWVDRMFERLETLVPWAYQRTEEAVPAWTVPAPREPDAPPRSGEGRP